MNNFMAQAQQAHEMHQHAFDIQNQIHQHAFDIQNQMHQQMVNQQQVQHGNAVQSAEYQSNQAYIESLRSRVKAEQLVIAEEQSDFDKEWEAHCKAIRDFDINDFSNF